MKHYHNRETEKLELHFDRSEYDALPETAKDSIKSAFLWSRSAGAWVSRAKHPNLYRARRVAESLGSEDGGETGEKISFAEQMQRKAERAEARAERYEEHADNAQTRGAALQEPINHMHGDIAFFTQPNISSGAGRAFTRRREKMFAAFERGMDEYRKSAYYQERAATARETAAGTRPTDRGFIDRRIKDAEKEIRALKRSIEEREKTLARIESGENLSCYDGSPVTVDGLQKWLDRLLDMLDTQLDKLAYYQDCMDEAGGVKFSPDNVKNGYTVFVRRWGKCEVVSVGKVNATVRILEGGAANSTLSVAFAEIESVVSTDEAREPHPFAVGDTFNVHRWNAATVRYEPVEYTIIKAAETSVTLKTGDEKPIVRKPRPRPYSKDEWTLGICDGHDGTVFKKAPETLSLAEFAERVGK